jgi:Flp pilus assembly protein TadG
VTPIRPLSRALAALTRAWRNEQASQIAEFAVSLPLLVVFIVGIFDFSGAFTLKQKLANAVREGARVAAADPANDLTDSSSGVPASVSDAFQVVDNYLLAEKINDCGLGAKTPANSSALTWSATSTGSCPGAGIAFTINRGCVTQQTLAGTPTSMVATCVTLTYPYSWRFSTVSSLLGRTILGPSNLTTTAVAYNEN